MQPHLVRQPSGSYTDPNDPGEPGYASGAPRVSVTDVEGRILSALCRRANVLEIGTGLGVSTRWIAQTASGISTVDTDDWVHKNVQLPTNVQRFASVDEIPIGPQFDVAFIDGCHAASQIDRDIRDATSRLRAGGLIVLHDVNTSSVRSAAQLAGELVLVDTAHGLGLLWPR